MFKAHIETGRGEIDRLNLSNNRRYSESLFWHVYYGNTFLGVLSVFAANDDQEAIIAFNSGKGVKHVQS